MPVDMELLNKTDSGNDNSGASFLSRVGGNPSGPHDELVFSFRSTLATLSVGL